MEPLIEKIRKNFIQAINKCNEDVTHYIVLDYTPAQKEEYGVPTSSECERLKALYRRISYDLRQ